MTSPNLVLASSSAYRRALLQRLNLRFTTLSPEVDETPLPGETPRALAERLARLKARTGLTMAPGALVIGSDQVAECEGAPLGKPGSIAGAERQLLGLQGRTVHFHTTVCVTNGDTTEAVNVPTVVQMRRLTRDHIRRYVDQDQPVDCAGAFKSEALGISLIESMRSDDPTALVGLPLIATINLLERFGVAIL